MSLSSLLLPLFDIGLQDGQSELKQSLTIIVGVLATEFIEPISELIAELYSLLLETLSRGLLRFSIIKILL